MRALVFFCGWRLSAFAICEGAVFLSGEPATPVNSISATQAARSPKVELARLGRFAGRGWAFVAEPGGLRYHL